MQVQYYNMYLFILVITYISRRRYLSECEEYSKLFNIIEVTNY